MGEGDVMTELAKDFTSGARWFFAFALTNWAVSDGSHATYLAFCGAVLLFFAALFWCVGNLRIVRA